MKIVKTIAIVAFFTLALGTAGHYDKQHEILEAASAQCQNQTEHTTPTFLECINNQLEENNDR